LLADFALSFPKWEHHCCVTGAALLYLVFLKEFSAVSPSGFGRQPWKEWRGFCPWVGLKPRLVCSDDFRLIVLVAGLGFCQCAKLKLAKSLRISFATSLIGRICFVSTSSSLIFAVSTLGLPKDRIGTNALRFSAKNASKSPSECKTPCFYLPKQEIHRAGSLHSLLSILL